MPLVHLGRSEGRRRTAPGPEENTAGTSVVIADLGYAAELSRHHWGGACHPKIRALTAT